MMRHKKKVFQFCLIMLVFVVLVGIVIVRNSIRTSIISEREKAAETTVQVFCENLTTRLTNLNYANSLSYTLEEGQDNLQLFSMKAEKLLHEKKEIIYIAYFKDDILQTMLPEKTYGNVKGKKLSDFSYSYTLAKVIKQDVIEGPDRLKESDKDAYLFIHPIVKNNVYQGEIIVALDSEYVSEEMQLNLLHDYDYEIWKVNSLGEHKKIIVTSDETLDFSNAVKLEFNLPSTWNLSIMRKGGWLSSSETKWIDACCIIAALLFLVCIYFVYRTMVYKKNLLIARYTDSDSGLLSVEGFEYFANRILKRNAKKDKKLLYIHLLNFHTIMKLIRREEVLAYLARVRQSIYEEFSANTLAARLDEDVIAVLLEEDQEHLVEDFVLQLYWKIHVSEEKLFVEPLESIVHYPLEGNNIHELIDSAKEKQKVE